MLASRTRPFFRPVFARGTRPMSSSFSALPKSYIVSPHALQAALHDQDQTATSPLLPRIVTLSAAWFLPNAPITGHQSFQQRRIHGSVFFDLDAVKADSPYPHMLPPTEVFTAAMDRLGITRDDAVVLYDSPEQGLFSAPRAAWTFRQFRHPRVHILDNFKEWVAKGLPAEEGGDPLQRVHGRHDEHTKYTIPQELDVAPNWVGFDDVKSWTTRQIEGPRRDEGEPFLLDARPAARFTGESPEPRDGISSGHVPGSINVPFSDLLDPESKTLKSKEELEKLFKSKGITAKNAADGNGLKIISSCGTGVTAAVIDLALEKVGWSEAERGIYDGSWTEWASRAKDQEGFIIKGKD